MLRGLIAANQRSWMSAVARVTGGATFEAGGVTCVRHGDEVVIAFPDALPSHEVMDRDAARIGCWAAEPSPGLDEHLRGLGFEPGWRPHWMTAAAAAAEPDPRVSEPPEVPEYDDHGQALVDSASSRAAALGVETLTLNAENEEFWAAAGFRSLGHGQTWWHRRS